jgi:hypothetical protein
MSALSVVRVATDTASHVGPKELASIVEAYAKVLALVVAGFWTYLLFVRQRQRYPRATIAQTGMIRDLGNATRLMTIGVSLSNVGQRLIDVDYITVVVQQLAPLGPKALEQALASHEPLNAAGRREIVWFRIGHRRTGFEPRHFEIEPGETESVEFDFVVAASVTTIKVQTHIENVVKRPVLREWARSAIHMIPLRSPNRCLGWQCTSYFNFPPSAATLTKLADVSNPED